MRNKRKGYQTIIQASPDPRCIVSNAIEPAVTDRRVVIINLEPKVTDRVDAVDEVGASE